MKEFREAFGRRIKLLRKNRRITQEKLAEIIGLNPRQLTRIETGENFPSSDTLVKLSMALDLDVKYMFDFDWDPEIAMLATGTDAKPLLRLVQNNEVVTIKSYTPVIAEEVKESKHFPVTQSEESMKKIAKKINKPLTVEYFINKKRANIKTYYPNGKIENLLTEVDIQENEEYKVLCAELKKFAKSPAKLEFIKIALQVFDNKEAAEKLKLMLKGMDLNK